MKTPQKIREAKTRGEKLMIALDADVSESKIESFVALVFSKTQLSHPHPNDPPEVKRRQKTLPIIKNNLKQLFAELFFNALWDDAPEKFEELIKAMAAKRFVRSGVAISDPKQAKGGIAFLPKGQYSKPDFLRAEILGWKDGETIESAEAIRRLEKASVTNPAIKVPEQKNLIAIMNECFPERKRPRAGRPKIILK